MGIQISDIVPRKEIELKELKDKVIAIDALNTLYQFLTTIRQPDGTPLMDHNQKITSHLSGLFYRNINLLAEGIKLVYVFDGRPPELKDKEVERRVIAKIIAEEKFSKAKEEENVEEMRKYSSQFVRVNQQIIDESKELISAMGIPVIQAMGEGEAEAALLARNSKTWASASQDYDSLLYGTPRLIRNLTLARKRKTSSGVYVDVNIELVDFENLLNTLQINRDQLICIGIMVGTDYNPGGIKGIGQKTALDIAKKYQYPVQIFKYISENPKYKMEFDWQEIYRLFHEAECCVNPDLKFLNPDKEKIKNILLSRDFSAERIDSGLEKLNVIFEQKKQKGLKEFF